LTSPHDQVILSPWRSRENQFQHKVGRHEEQIFDMEEVQAMPEDLRLMIHFDPEALTDIQMAEAPL
jgi:hypothetical protein